MRRRKILWARWLMSMAVVSFLLSGCAAGPAAGPATGPTQAPATSRMEQMLVQAGFKLFPETSPDCQAVCRKLPSGQLVPHKKGDQMVYAYVSPDAKRLYAGDEAAYQRFINLAVVQNLEPRQRAVTETNTEDPEFWTLWQNSQGGG
jgi:hypothetical protein